MAVRPGRLATPNLRNWSQPKGSLERIIGRSHPQGEKEYKLDLETEWCDRHYQEHQEKANTDGRDTVARRSDNRWTISYRMDTPWT